MAVAAAGAGAGDEVICDPVVHFGGCAVLYNNAVPVFADIDPYTFTIDPAAIRERISERTKAIICTNLFGLPCDYDPIMEIAGEYNLIVIEDNAQAVGATYKGKYTGSIGHIGVFSFQQSKQLATGDGGMCLTSDKHLHDEMRITRLIGWLPEKRGDVAQRWREGRLGWNYRNTEMVAAVLMGQLDKADAILDNHRKAGAILTEALEGCEWLLPQRVDEERTHTYWVYGCRFEGEKVELTMDEFKRLAAEKELAASYHYTTLTSSAIPLFTEIRAYGKGCPIECPLYEGDVKYGVEQTPNCQELLDRLVLLGFSAWDLDFCKQQAEKIAEVRAAVE